MSPRPWSAGSATCPERSDGRDRSRQLAQDPADPVGPARHDDEVARRVDPEELPAGVAACAEAGGRGLGEDPTPPVEPPEQPVVGMVDAGDDGAGDPFLAEHAPPGPFAPVEEQAP